MPIRRLAAVLIGGVLMAWASPAASQTPRVEWRLDSLDRIGGHAVTVVGQPTMVDTDRGRAIQFDCVDDGLLIASNPLAGRDRFTVEVLFQPATGGPEEQRFVHFEEAKTGHRALIELRMTPDGRWALDTFLRSPEPGLTLLDRAITHASGAWHVARVSYDGKTMTHFVDGVRVGAGDVTFTPLRDGQTSLGMRQTVEMHIFERGEHGFGTRSDLGTTSGWVDRWFDWMRAGGWLPAAPGGLNESTRSAAGRPGRCGFQRARAAGPDRVGARLRGATQGRPR